MIMLFILMVTILLIMVPCEQVPREIVEMLSCRDIIKVGVAVLDDAHKLFEDYDIEVCSSMRNQFQTIYVLIIYLNLNIFLLKLNVLLSIIITTFRMLQVNNCLDLRYMAAFGDDHTVNSVGDFSLAGLARELAGISLNKADSLRCANWQAPALSNAEIVSD